MPNPIMYKQSVYDEATGEDVEILHEIPSVYTVCHECNGEGKSSAYLGVISDEDSMDEDFMEAYMAGRYDRPCAPCKGLRVVAIMDPNWLDKNPEIRQMIDDDAAEEREYRAVCRAERAFGA